MSSIILPPLARMNENIEQISTQVQQLRQSEQANQQCTHQKEVNEAFNLQLVQRLAQVVRSSINQITTACSYIPQMTVAPQVIRMQANLARLQSVCSQLEQQMGANHQTTQQKQQHEASCAQLSQRIEQTVQDCQQDISQFIPAQQQPITTPAWAQQAAQQQAMQQAVAQQQAMQQQAMQQAAAARQCQPFAQNPYQQASPYQPKQPFYTTMPSPYQIPQPYTQPMQQYATPCC